MDEKAPLFSVDEPMYKDQLAKDLAVNIYKDGQWGSYRHLLLEESPVILANHSFVNILTRGDISSLKWVEGPIDTKT